MTDAEITGKVTAQSDIEVKLTVKNEGGAATEDVVEIYIKDMGSPLAVRNYSLCAFKRVSLAAGESRTITVTVANAAMNVVDEAGERHIDSRHFKLFA